MAGPDPITVDKFLAKAIEHEAKAESLERNGMAVPAIMHRQQAQKCLDAAEGIEQLYLRNLKRSN